MSEKQVRSFEESFSGLWSYLNYDHISLATATDTNKVGNADSKCMVDQCQEMTEKYRSSQKPIDRYLTDELLSSSNNQKNGSGKKKNQTKTLTQKQREKLHATTMNEHMTKLFSSIFDEKSRSSLR